MLQRGFGSHILRRTLRVSHPRVASRKFSEAYRSGMGLDIQPDDTISEIDTYVAMAEYAAQESETFLSSSSTFGWIVPYRTLQATLGVLHDLGCPWWVLPMLLPWLIKFAVVLPFKVTNERHLMNIKPRLEEAIEKQAKIEENYSSEKITMTKKTRALIKEYGFSPTLIPYRSILTPFIHLPFHLTSFVAIQNMYPRFETWREGGFLWVENLAACDPAWSIPMLTGGLALLNIELNAKHTIRTTNGITILYASRGMTMFMVPIMCYFSAGFNLYTLSNVACHALYMRLLLKPDFRERVGLAPFKESAVFMDHLNELLWRKKETTAKPSSVPKQLRIIVNQGVKIDRRRLKKFVNTKEAATKT